MCFGEGLGLADLHWGGFTNQWGNKKRINGADEKSTPMYVNPRTTLFFLTYKIIISHAVL